MTSRYIDCQKTKSHKFVQHKHYSIASHPKVSKLLPRVARSNKSSLQRIECKLVTCYGERESMEFGVFGNRNNSKRMVIPGLDGYLVRVPNGTINEKNDWSLFGATANHKAERVMLGPTLFANHSCDPNAECVCSREKSATIVKVLALTDIKQGYEI